MKKTIIICMISIIGIYAGILLAGPQHSMTKIVKKGNIQFAFDLMDKKSHHKMMKMMKMKMKMKHDSRSDHHIGLTLMKKPENKIIKNAKVRLTVSGPSGKKTKKAHIMKGKGMFHYGAGFRMAKPGKYTVKARVKIGAKKLTAKVVFHLH